LGKSGIVKDIGKLEVWWNSEDHRPPHFHVKHQEEKWQIRVKFLQCTPNHLEYEFKIPRSRKDPIAKKDRDAILGQMKTRNNSMKHRQLYKEWNNKVQIHE
jgi:hypothetical protein